MNKHKKLQASYHSHVYDISVKRYTHQLIDKHPPAFVTDHSKKLYWHPRYWPKLFTIGLLRLVTKLPYDWQINLGAALGKVAYRLARSRRHIAEVNIGLCFPKLSDQEKAKLVRDIFINNGIGIIETSFAWSGNIETIVDRFSTSGLEHLEAAQHQNTGVILLGMHFSTLDLCGAILNRQAPFHVMYRKNKDTLLNETMRQGRERHFAAAIERADIRSVIRALKAKHTVWYGPDQDYGPKQSVFAPFFGIETASITATARIARMTGAKVVPFRHFRTSDNRYKIELLPALQAFPSGDDVQDASTINELVEAAVEIAPSQYWWVHRRFKTRPSGEQRPY